jgi:hypothetical protein
MLELLGKQHEGDDDRDPGRMAIVQCIGFWMSVLSLWYANILHANILQELFRYLLLGFKSHCTCIFMPIAFDAHFISEQVDESQAIQRVAQQGL